MNTRDFAIRIQAKNLHDTNPKSRVARFLNNNAGRANLPTSAVILLASLGLINLNLPNIYPINITAKDSAIAGNKLLIDGWVILHLLVSTYEIGVV